MVASSVCSTRPGQVEARDAVPQQGCTAAEKKVVDKKLILNFNLFLFIWSPTISDKNFLFC